MRRNISSHTYGNTCSTVDQQIRITTGQYYRLFFGIIKVRYEIYGIFTDICQKLHGNLGKSCLGITHCCGTVTIHGTEVTVTVYERITGRPVLCHINQCAIDGAVTMRMIFTHGITDNTGTFTMRFVGTIVQFDHRIEYTSLYRLQTIPHIRKRTGCDNTHGIVDIESFHFLFQIDFMDFINLSLRRLIKNIVVHVSSQSVVKYDSLLLNTVTIQILI